MSPIVPHVCRYICVFASGKKVVSFPESHYRSRYVQRHRSNSIVVKETASPQANSTATTTDAPTPLHWLSLSLGRLEAEPSRQARYPSLSFLLAAARASTACDSAVCPVVGCPVVACPVVGCPVVVCSNVVCPALACLLLLPSYADICMFSGTVHCACCHRTYLRKRTMLPDSIMLTIVNINAN